MRVNPWIFTFEWIISGAVKPKIVPICDTSTKLGMYVDKCMKKNSGYWGNGNTPSSGHSTTLHTQLAEPRPIFIKIYVEPICFGI